MSAIRINTRCAWWLTMLLAAAGCSRQPETPLPTTFPVSGKVVSRAGRPMAGGAVQFQCTTDAKVTAIGEIRPDGSFSLSYPFERKRLPGTVAGQYRVTVIPPMTDAQTGVPIELPQAYTVEAKENRFTIPVDLPRR